LINWKKFEKNYIIETKKYKDEKKKNDDLIINNNMQSEQIQNLDDKLKHETEDKNKAIQN
jgi:hypothetical protein